MDNGNRHIGRLEGIVEEFKERFDKIDGQLICIQKKLSDLESWKWRVTGMAAGVAILAEWFARIIPR